MRNAFRKLVKFDLQFMAQAQVSLFYQIMKFELKLLTERGEKDTKYCDLTFQNKIKRFSCFEEARKN